MSDHAMAIGVPGTLGYIAEVERIEKKIEGLKAFLGPNVNIAEQLSAEEYKFYWTSVLTSWDASKATMAEATERETVLRKKFVALVVPAGKYGTSHFNIGEGYDAKTVTGINYGFIKLKDPTGKEVGVDKTAIDAALSEIEKTGPVGAYIAAKLIKWTPSLSVTEYNQLVPSLKEIIDKVLEKKDKAPTLEIIAPKAKR